MTEAVSVLALDGACDGIRFGRMRFASGQVRSFHADLLSGTVRLFTREQPNARPQPDADPARVAAAQAALAHLLEPSHPQSFPEWPMTRTASTASPAERKMHPREAP